MKGEANNAGNPTTAELYVWLLKTLGITQSELARRTGTSKQMISNRVSGLRNQPLPKFIAMAKKLGVDVEVTTTVKIIQPGADPVIFERD